MPIPLTASNGSRFRVDVVRRTAAVLHLRSGYAAMGYYSSRRLRCRRRCPKRNSPAAAAVAIHIAAPARTATAGGTGGAGGGPVFEVARKPPGEHSLLLLSRVDGREA